MALEQRIDSSLEARIAALAENFKAWGWDPEVVKAVSKYSGFHCTDETFGFQLGDPNGIGLKFNLRVSNFPHNQEAIRYVYVKEVSKAGTLEVNYQVLRMNYRKGSSRWSNSGEIIIVTPGDDGHQLAVNGSGFFKKILFIL